MTILAIGDLHGKKIWQEAVTKIAADHIVFLGDYINAKRWLFNGSSRANLEALLLFKHRNFDRVHLLLGNHDMLYLDSTISSTLPIRRVLTAKMFRLYRDNAECFEIAYQKDRFLFTHAGVSQSWYDRHRTLLMRHRGDTLAEKLNAVQRSSHSNILHEKGRTRGGTFEHGGVTYADKVETERNGLRGYVQIVGHTKVKEPTVHKNEKGSVLYLDCLNSVTEFLLINENEASIITLDGHQRKLEAF